MVAVVAHAGLRATLIHRVGHWASMSGIPWLPTALSQLNLMLHGIELGPSVPIGPGLYMPHTTGSVVHARRIGSNVTLQGGITVGMRGVQEFPTISDGVVLCAGCRVLGAVTVGEHAVVGANAVVIEDVPMHTTAVGVPARCLRPRI